MIKRQSCSRSTTIDGSTHLVQLLTPALPAIALHLVFSGGPFTASTCPQSCSMRNE